MRLFTLGLVSLVTLASASDTICYTKEVSKKPEKRHTHWYHSYSECTSTITHVTTVTKPGKRPTTTSTVETTITSTAPGSTGTATDTETETDTTVVTTVSTSTSVVTSETTLTSTSTVPTSVGFLPIQTTLPDSSYDGAQGGSPAEKRDTFDIEIELPLLGGSSGKQMYAGDVDCVEWKKGHCAKVTTTKTRTTTASGSKRTKTLTRTLTVTTTITPAATTTTTTTITTTSTSTDTSVTVTTSTSTITDTDAVPAATPVYAACATNNFADLVNGGKIFAGNPPATAGQFVTRATDAYSCCVNALLQNPGIDGEASVWLYAPFVGATNCFIFTTPGCPAGLDQSNMFSAQPGGNNVVTLGNSYCGQYSSFRG